MGRVKEYFIDQINQGPSDLAFEDPYDEWMYRMAHFPVAIIDDNGEPYDVQIDLNKHPDIIFQFDIANTDDGFYVSCTDDTQFIADKKIELYVNVKERQT